MPELSGMSRFLPSSYIPPWPPSSRCLLSPPLLALLYDFAQIHNRPYLNRPKSILKAWLLRDKLNGMIEVSCLKDLNAAKLFLGFRVGAIRRRDFAVFPVQGQRGLRRLKRYFSDKMSVGAQMVVVLKAFVKHRVSLVLGHPFEFSWLDVSQTDVFHRFFSSFFSLGWEPAAQPYALDRSFYSRRAQRKSTAEANYFYFNSWWCRDQQ